MRLKVINRDYTEDKITMITSRRGCCYSIHFQELGNSDGYCPEFWGHLNKEQAKRMVDDLIGYIISET